MIVDQDRMSAEHALQQRRLQGHAVAARFDMQGRCIRVCLHTGVELSVDPVQIDGLISAPAEQLAEIHITPSGLGLYWPVLDVDVSVEELLRKHA